MFVEICDITVFSISSTNYSYQVNVTKPTSKAQVSFVSTLLSIIKHFKLHLKHNKPCVNYCLLFICGVISIDGVLIIGREQLALYPLLKHMNFGGLSVDGILSVG